MMLYKLLGRTDRTIFQPRVISMTDIGPTGARITDLGIEVASIGMKRGRISPSGLIRLALLLKKNKADLIQTWMYHADLVGGLVAQICSIPVVWNIRHVNLDPRINKRSTIWTAKLCAKLAGVIPEKIVINSKASKDIHIALGYTESKMIVIPNGFDTEIFKPNLESVHYLRNQLDISQDRNLIGFIARFDAQKDHGNFIEAARLLRQKRSDVQFVLCGQDVDWENHQLSAMINEAGLRHCFSLLGKRDDIPLITASLDIATSASVGEGFSNIIGEAMSCGVPCVVTDVGDSAFAVGETGIVVPPQKPSALADGWLKMLTIGKHGRHLKGSDARTRVVTLFSIERIVKQYEDLYHEIINIRRNR